MLADITSDRQVFFANSEPEKRTSIFLPTGTATAAIIKDGEIFAIDSTQAWFWTEEWQAGEREVDEHIARGEVEEFDTIDDMFRSLNE